MLVQVPIHPVKKAQLEDEERIPLPPVPWSVFYKGRRPSHCYSFRKPHELRDTSLDYIARRNEIRWGKAVSY